MRSVERKSHTLPNGRVVSVKIIYQSWLARIFIPGKTAITVWNRVFVRPPTVYDWVIRHELRHVEQWYAKGVWRFLFTYLWYSLRYGYRNNPYEVDARSAE